MGLECTDEPVDLLALRIISVDLDNIDGDGEEVLEYTCVELEDICVVVGLQDILLSVCLHLPFTSPKESRLLLDIEALDVACYVIIQTSHPEIYP